jgi:hypothetical protein
MRDPIDFKSALVFSDFVMKKALTRCHIPYAIRNTRASGQRRLAALAATRHFLHNGELYATKRYS